MGEVWWFVTVSWRKEWAWGSNSYIFCLPRMLFIHALYLATNWECWKYNMVLMAFNCISSFFRLWFMLLIFFLVRFLMDMEENMLLTSPATIYQGSLQRMRISLWRLIGLLRQHSSKLILLLQKPAPWMLILLLVQLLWQLLLLGG